VGWAWGWVVASAGARVAGGAASNSRAGTTKVGIQLDHMLVEAPQGLLARVPCFKVVSDSC
jgi:hypothetical protein